MKYRSSWFKRRPEETYLPSYLRELEESSWSTSWIVSWRGWVRTNRVVVLVGFLAFLTPGLAMGAFQVNDFLNADLLPGSLFLREGSILDLDVNNTLNESASQTNNSAHQYGNWSDAFSTMNFHRTMMNEYLCRTYLAEEILGGVVDSSSEAVTPPEDGATMAALKADKASSRISSTLVVGDASGGRGVAPPPLPPPPFLNNSTSTPRGVGRTQISKPAFRRKKRKRKRKKPPPATERRRLDAMLSDEGSSAYKDWLARTTLLEDIYRHYDHTAQGSETSTNSVSAEEGGETLFEGGEVTGFALTHVPQTPQTVPHLPQVPQIAHLPQPAVIPHIPIPSYPNPIATSINNFASASPSASHLPIGPPLPPSSPGHVYGPPSISSVGIPGYEERHPYDFEEEHEVEHHPVEHYESYPEHHEKHYHHMLSLKDLFDLVLTAIAFLAFGAFVMHLILCLMHPPQYPYMEVPITAPPGTGTGAGEAEGGKRRKKRSNRDYLFTTGMPLTAEVPVEVLDRAALRVLASIDAALLQMRDAPKRTARKTGDTIDKSTQEEEKESQNVDCVRRALCKHNRHSRTVTGSLRVWMPIWSVGMSWLSARLSPGESSVASAALGNLRASVLGLGNAKCHIIYPRCSIANKRTVHATPNSYSDTSSFNTPVSISPVTSPEVTTPVVITPVHTTPVSSSKTPVPGVVTLKGLSRPPQGQIETRFTPIGFKTNSNKRRRRP